MLWGYLQLGMGVLDSMKKGIDEIRIISGIATIIISFAILYIINLIYNLRQLFKNNIFIYLVVILIGLLGYGIYVHINKKFNK